MRLVLTFSSEPSTAQVNNLHPKQSFCLFVVWCICGAFETKENRQVVIINYLPIVLSDSGGIQTHNLLIRSQMLYSVELRNHCSLKASAKVRCFAEIAKCFGNFFRKK